MCFSLFSASGQAEKTAKAFYGKYISCKWVDLPVTELAYEDADKYLNRELTISKSSVTLFSSTYDHVNFETSKHEFIDYFRVFRHFDFRRIDSTVDSLAVLTVVTSDSDIRPSFDIIILKDFLITEYKGYFYYFRRRK